MGAGVQRHDTVALPRKGPVNHCIEGWAHRPVWRVRKISPATGFGPRTVQPVACRYTVDAILAQYNNTVMIILLGYGFCHVCSPSAKAQIQRGGSEADGLGLSHMNSTFQLLQKHTFTSYSSENMSVTVGKII